MTSAGGIGDWLIRQTAAAPRSVSDLDGELVQELPDALFDLIADRSDRFDVLARGILELRVEVALAGEERARVAAAHGDDDVGGAHDLVGPRLGELVCDVDADLGHCKDRGRIDFLAGFGST